MRFIAAVVATSFISVPVAAQSLKQKGPEIELHFDMPDGTVYSVLLDKARAISGLPLPKEGSTEKLNGKPRSLRRAFDTLIANAPRGKCSMEYLTLHIEYGKPSEIATLTGTHAVCKRDIAQSGRLMRCDDKAHMFIVWDGFSEFEAKTKLCPKTQ